MLFLSFFVMLTRASVYRCLVVTCLERVDLLLSFVMLPLSHLYPGSGVVLDCIDS